MQSPRIPRTSSAARRLRSQPPRAPTTRVHPHRGLHVGEHKGEVRELHDAPTTSDRSPPRARRRGSRSAPVRPTRPPLGTGTGSRSACGGARQATPRDSAARGKLTSARRIRSANPGASTRSPPAWPRFTCRTAQPVPPSWHEVRGTCPSAPFEQPSHDRRRLVAHQGPLVAASPPTPRPRHPTYPPAPRTPHPIPSAPRSA